MNGLPSWLAPLALRWDRVLFGALAVRCDVSLQRDADAPHDLRLHCEVKLRPVIQGKRSTPKRRRLAVRQSGQD